MVQKKKSDEQDVLVVRDEKTGEISVVAGLSRDGTPKRAPAKAENTPDFLRFDRNSDLMDSFSETSSASARSQVDSDSTALRQTRQKTCLA